MNSRRMPCALLTLGRSPISQFQRLAGLAVVLMSGLFLPAAAHAQLWYFDAQRTFWERDEDQTRKDFFNAANNNIVVSDSTYPFKFEWGDRFILGYDTGLYQLEGEYLRIDWDTGLRHGHFPNPVNLVGPQAPGGFMFVNGLNIAGLLENNDTGNMTDDVLEEAEFRTYYKTDFDSAELTLKRVQSGRSWLMLGLGTRVGTLDELWSLIVDGELVDGPDTNEGLGTGAEDELALSGLTLVAGPPGFDANGFAPEVDMVESTFTADTSNTFVGLQLVADASIWETSLLFVEGLAKGGVFWNHTTGTLTETHRERLQVNGDEGTVYTRTFRDEDDTVAFLGNVAVFGGIKLRENIRIKFGYEVQFITGVALGIDQWEQVRIASITNPDGVGDMATLEYQVENDGTIIAHGGTGALEVIW